MLQRIYGTAFATKDELKAYLHMLEEAARATPQACKDMDLFHLQKKPRA